MVDDYEETGSSNAILPLGVLQSVSGCEEAIQSGEVVVLNRIESNQPKRIENRIEISNNALSMAESVCSIRIVFRAKCAIITSCFGSSAFATGVLASSRLGLHPRGSCFIFIGLSSKSTFWWRNRQEEPQQFANWPNMIF